MQLLGEGQGEEGRPGPRRARQMARCLQSGRGEHQEEALVHPLSLGRGRVGTAGVCRGLGGNRPQTC